MFKSGFFDSANGDRKYTASDFAELINMLVTDGVAGGYKEQMAGSLNGDGYIRIGTGRAWANSTWNAIDAAEYISIPSDMLPSSSSYQRLGVVSLAVNKSASVRANSLLVTYADSLISASTQVTTASFDGLIPDSEALGGGFPLFGFAITSSAGAGVTYWLAPIITGIGNQTDVRSLLANMRATFDAFLASASETLSNTNAFLKLENEIATVRAALPSFGSREIITVASVTPTEVSPVSATISDYVIWSGDIRNLNGVLPKIHLVAYCPSNTQGSHFLEQNSSTLHFLGLAPGGTDPECPQFLLDSRPLSLTYTGGTLTEVGDSRDEKFISLPGGDVWVLQTFDLISHDYRNWNTNERITFNVYATWVDNGDDTQSLVLNGSLSWTPRSGATVSRDLALKAVIDY